MPWIVPIFDRTLADVTDKTSKGFFNVVDWVRIHGNTTHVRAMMSALRSVNIDYNALVEPGITSIPTAAEINDFIENIETLRAISGIPESFGLNELKDNYISGASETTPNYSDVNEWEECLAVLKEFLLNSSVYEVFCGVSEVGQVRFWQNRFRSPFVRDADSPIRVPRCGVAVSGRGRMAQNKFRRYA
jgi:hypothetical protein